MEEAVRIIEVLLAFLPDSYHKNDESWDWCWNELSDKAQEDVKKARVLAIDFLVDR